MNSSEMKQNLRAVVCMSFITVSISKVRRWDRLNVFFRLGVWLKVMLRWWSCTLGKEKPVLFIGSLVAR